jgi:hypothetical protein
LLTAAALAPGTFVAVVIGGMLGGVISVLVVWREMAPTAEKKGSPSRDPATFAMAMRRVAAIYLAIALLFLGVAIITGGATPMIVTALNLGVGLMGFVVARRSGSPKATR